MQAAPIAQSLILSPSLVVSLNSLFDQVEQTGQIDILWTLGRKTLERMAENPGTAASVLKRLACHPMPEVRGAVGDNQNTPVEVLWSLAQDEDADVRYQLAENPRLPDDIITALASDQNPYVASRAAQTIEKIGR